MKLLLFKLAFNLQIKKVRACVLAVPSLVYICFTASIAIDLKYLPYYLASLCWLMGSVYVVHWSDCYKFEYKT